MFLTKKPTDNYTPQKYMENMLFLLDKLLYVAFQRKKVNDYENLPMRGLVITEKEIEQAFELPISDEKLTGKTQEAIWRMADKILKEQERAGFLPFLAICESFRLNSLERFALLVGAAPLYHRKYISLLFQKARDINALLFFDEADSLFARRSAVSDSHDRNANAETAHLLQKLENYEGITVLATNYLSNIDDAFKRRIKFVINIAFPEARVRLELWRGILPETARCDEELDFDFFAEHFELPGSGIKEVLTNAAYLAASEHRGLVNRDLVEAVKLNYAKYGKVLTDADFGYLV